jgi:hypothetical protein
MWQLIVLILLLFAVSYLGSRGSTENFTHANFPPYGPYDTTRKLCGNHGFVGGQQPILRHYWGPYMWGWNSRPFYKFRYNSQTPYPYQNDCDHFARETCKGSADPFCYKSRFMKCASGTALVDPVLCKEPRR